MCASSVLKSCEVCLRDEKLHDDLIMLDLFDFDVILGTEKRLLLSLTNDQYFAFEESKVIPLPRLLTAMKAEVIVDRTIRLHTQV